LNVSSTHTARYTRRVMPANRSDEILEAALGLPARERLRIVRNLLDSIDDEARRDEDWEASWSAELERRSREMRDGTVELLDGETVFAEIESELKKNARQSKAPGKPRRRARSR